ncbi:hypothetical protein HMPREF1572_00607 [Gardnerella vaginalis JCP7275]|nr:hypothetical protein HMPREF1572_00607 [Gardnerella vaginalis JCP7275]
MCHNVLYFVHSNNCDARVLSKSYIFCCTIPRTTKTGKVL